MCAVGTPLLYDRHIAKTCDGEPIYGVVAVLGALEVHDEPSFEHHLEQAGDEQAPLSVAGARAAAKRLDGHRQSIDIFLDRKSVLLEQCPLAAKVPDKG